MHLEDAGTHAPIIREYACTDICESQYGRGVRGSHGEQLLNKSSGHTECSSYCPNALLFPQSVQYQCQVEPIVLAGFRHLMV